MFIAKKEDGFKFTGKDGKPIQIDSIEIPTLEERVELEAAGMKIEVEIKGDIPQFMEELDVNGKDLIAFFFDLQYKERYTWTVKRMGTVSIIR